MTNQEREVLSDEEIIELRKRTPFAVGLPWRDTIAFARAIENAAYEAGRAAERAEWVRDAPDAAQIEYWRSLADELLRAGARNVSEPTLRTAAFQLQNAYLSWRAFDARLASASGESAA